MRTQMRSQSPMSSRAHATTTGSRGCSSGSLEQRLRASLAGVCSRCRPLADRRDRAREGLFAAVGARVADTPGGPLALLAGLLLAEAVVTAVLNLDTAVVFMTPVL